MKSVLFLIALLPSSLFAQQVTCLKSGTVALADVATVTCSVAPAPAPVPPPTPAPVSGCDPVTSYNGLARQCSGSVAYQYPINSKSWSGTLYRAEDLMLGTWANHVLVSGKYFTLQIASGQYVSFAITPTDALHGVTLAYNQTGGANGHFWMSRTAGGAPTSNGVYGTCESYSSANMQIYPFSNYPCYVTPGQTYYLNWSDGQPIAYTIY